ncbi:MAG: hypothetical protein NVV59_19710 [Chitinophagaceae bacterium]|nr:hypothetical protein [Chitinophagaceae bacterium]
MRNLICALAGLLLTLSVCAQGNDVVQQKKSAFADSLWSLYQASRGENLALFQGRQIMSGYPGIGGSAFLSLTRMGNWKCEIRRLLVLRTGSFV